MHAVYTYYIHIYGTACIYAYTNTSIKLYSIYIPYTHIM